jgi:hypothetical protein
MGSHAEPRVTSEVSSRLLSLDPCVREFFNLDIVTMSGKELEDLACAVWMLGYSAALGEIIDLPNNTLDLTPIMEQWGWDEDGPADDAADHVGDDQRA